MSVSGFWARDLVWNLGLRFGLRGEGRQGRALGLAAKGDFVEECRAITEFKAEIYSVFCGFGARLGALLRNVGCQKKIMAAASELLKEIPSDTCRQTRSIPQAL